MRGGIWAGVLGLVLAGCASTAVTSSAPTTSWGKANVSMDDYLNDANYCAASAASVRAPPQVLIQSRMTGGGSATPGTAEAAQASNDALLAAANDHLTAQIHADNRARLDAENQCLRDHGYTQFRYTDEQRHHIDALAAGSPERARYMHQLAADPAVVSAQHATP